MEVYSRVWIFIRRVDEKPISVECLEEQKNVLEPCRLLHEF